MSLEAAYREGYVRLKEGVEVSVPDRERGGQKAERVRVAEIVAGGPCLTSAPLPRTNLGAMHTADGPMEVLGHFVSAVRTGAPGPFQTDHDH